MFHRLNVKIQIMYGGYIIVYVLNHAQLISIHACIGQ